MKRKYLYSGFLLLVTKKFAQNKLSLRLNKHANFLEHQQRREKLAPDNIR